MEIYEKHKEYTTQHYKNEKVFNQTLNNESMNFL
jgi:hypothetical protein